MGRIKTFANGGSVLPSDLNNIQDDYEKAFSSYRTIARSTCSTPGALGSSSTYILVNDADSATAIVGAAGAYAMWGHYLDPADYAAGARTVKYRMRVTAIADNIAPACTFTFNLAPVATYGGTATQPTVATVGAAVSGSSVVIASPSAAAATTVTGTDFTAPSAGLYVVTLTVNASPAANNVMQLLATLQARQV